MNSIPQQNLDTFLKTLEPVQMNETIKRNDCFFAPVSICRLDVLQFQPSCLMTLATFPNHQVPIILSQQYSTAESQSLRCSQWTVLRFIKIIPGTFRHEYAFAFDARVPDTNIFNYGPFTNVESNPRYDTLVAYSKSNYSHCSIIFVPSKPKKENSFVTAYPVRLDFAHNQILEVRWYKEKTLSVLLRTFQVYIYDDIHRTCASDLEYETWNPVCVIDVPTDSISTMVLDVFDCHFEKLSVHSQGFFKKSIRLLSLSESGELFAIEKKFKIETSENINSVQSPNRVPEEETNNVQSAKAPKTTYSERYKISYNNDSEGDEIDVVIPVTYKKKSLDKNYNAYSGDVNVAFYKCTDALVDGNSHKNKDNAALSTERHQQRKKPRRVFTCFQSLQESPFFVFAAITLEGEIFVLAFDSTLNESLLKAKHIEWSEEEFSNFHAHIFLLETITAPTSWGSSPQLVPISADVYVPTVLVLTPEEIMLVEFPWLAQIRRLTHFQIQIPHLIETTTQSIFSLSKNNDDSLILGSAFYFTATTKKLINQIVVLHAIFKQTDLIESAPRDVLYQATDSGWDVSTEWTMSLISMEKYLCTPKHIELYEGVVCKLFDADQTSSEDVTNNSDFTLCKQFKNQLVYFCSLFEKEKIGDFSKMSSLLLKNGVTLCPNEETILLDLLDMAHQKIDRFKTFHSSIIEMHQNLSASEDFTAVFSKLSSSLLSIESFTKKLECKLEKIKHKMNQLSKLVATVMPLIWNKLVMLQLDFFEKEVFPCFLLALAIVPKHLTYCLYNEDISNGLLLEMDLFESNQSNYTRSISEKLLQMQVNRIRIQLDEALKQYLACVSAAQRSLVYAFS